MKHFKTLLLPVLLAPVLVALAAPGDKLAFHPAEGTTLVKSFTSKSQFSLDDLSMTMNGQPMPMDMDMQMDMSMHRRSR